MTYTTDELRQAARRRAEDFLENEKEYMLGFVEAEQANPLTKGLGEAAVNNPQLAAKMIFSVDRALADTYAAALGTPDYLAFAARVEKTLRAGGRLILSGCGATGRLCLNLEASWRRALGRIGETHPEHREAAAALAEQVATIMTGGDYALIKSVECFEDYAELGAQQAKLLGVGKGDLLIGVTATAETTSILGTALYASRQGANVQMVVCSDPQKVCERLERARRVFERENVYSVYLPCGAMAVTGSTRMQSSTIEQLVIAGAMQSAMAVILGEADFAVDYGSAFTALTECLLEPRTLAAVADYAAMEAAIYKKGELVTYFADEFLLDVLSDTTERSPTFVVPPFLPEGAKGSVSWAFVKDPQRSTQAAWRACLAHEPRCIGWKKEDYDGFGVNVDPVPQINTDDLMRYRIGSEDCPQREGRPGAAVWVGEETPADAFEAHACRYDRRAKLTLDLPGYDFPKTPMKIFEHITMKILLNTVSTMSMGMMGRLTSNFMTWLNMSNKKLIDRSTRLIMQECGVNYETALCELLYSDECIKRDQAGDRRSPAQETIVRLNGTK
ncbi:MAG: hypothetical protein IKV90_04395 [Clostridia bacterium]|nr:hypothetical protein [Clostridia bacterium]